MEELFPYWTGAEPELPAVGADLVLSGTDALRMLRLARSGERRFSLVCDGEPRATAFPQREVYVTLVRPVLEKLGLLPRDVAKKLQVRVGAQELLPRFVEVEGRVVGRALPAGSAWRVEPRDVRLLKRMEGLGLRVFVDAPALALVWYAREVARTVRGTSATRELVSFAWTLAEAEELCGCYVRGEAGKLWAEGVAQATWDVEPLLSAEELRAYLGGVSGFEGLRLARRVAAAVSGGLHSAEEAAWRASLALPPELGGFGLAWGWERDFEDAVRTMNAVLARPEWQLRRRYLLETMLEPPREWMRSESAGRR